MLLIRLGVISCIYISPEYDKKHFGVSVLDAARTVFIRLGKSHCSMPVSLLCISNFLSGMWGGVGGGQFCGT
jgi:hypothetical protein